MQTETLMGAPALAVRRTPWTRRAPALGIPAVVLFAISFAFAGSGPQSTDGDAKITSWYGSTSHQYEQLFGFIGFVLGALCLIGFLAALRARMAAVERAPGTFGQIAFGAGVASAVLSVLAVALFTVPAYLVIDTSTADVVPSTYRMFVTAAFACWMAGAMIGSLTVVATTVVAFRTGFLPRWFAWLGAVVAAIQLLAFFFVPEFVFWAWIVAAGLLLLRAPE
jgi:hypothetical protein